MSQPRPDLNQFEYTTRRASIPEDRFTSQEDRSTQARQENVRMEDYEAEGEVLYGPQNANWRFYSQFQDPVQGTQRRPRAPAQEAPPVGERQEGHTFLRPEIPRPRPDFPRPLSTEIPRQEPIRTEIPRQEIPRLIRTETHPPRHREDRGQRGNVQQPPRLQALRNKPSDSS